MNGSLENPHILSHKARLTATAVPGGTSSTAAIDAALVALQADVGQAQLFQALVQMLPQAAVFVVDADRNVLCWNDGAERLLGFKREEVLGRYCLTANRCHQCMLGCGISEYGSVTSVPLVLLDAAGEQVRVRKTARAFFDAEQRFIGGLEILVPDDPAPTVNPPMRAQPMRAQPMPAQPMPAQPMPAHANAAQAADARLGAAFAPTTDHLTDLSRQAVLRKLPSPRTLSPDELALKVKEALLRSDGHIGRACELLGVSRPTLWRWRRRFGIDA